MRKLTVFKFLLLFGFVQMIIPGVAQMYPPKKPHINDPDELHFARLKDNTQYKNGVYPPEGISKTLSRKTTPDAMTSCLYTSNAQLAALTTEDLIAYLRSTSDYLCHSAILFNYEAAYSPQLFTHEKIQAVANEIGIIAEGFDGTYANGIYGLICYLHVAEYFDFYYNSTISIDPPTLATIAAATDSVCKNPHMFDLNAEASVILEEFLIVLDQPGIRALPGTIGFMKQVMSNMLIDDTLQTTPNIDWVLGYWRIYYIMFRGCVNNDYDYLNAVDADPSFMHLWGGVAADIEIMNNPSINYLYQDNAVLELFRVVTNPMFTDSVCPHLAEVCNVFPRLHVNWLWAVIGVNRAGCCLQYNLCENEDNLRQELKNFLFPNVFLYNDGNLIFQAKFQRDAADNLYYATRQTQAQCLRLAQTDQPVTGDTNTRLNCIVFESKDAYDDYAFYLYGISTNNGGMYIEQRAEFYTWDRPATYGLSLEELFRHEYNHYVQGRYLIPGCWGQTAFYQNNRLTWYEEGHADFLCASTDNEGVKLKQ
jgi:hypothetical protein